MEGGVARRAGGVWNCTEQRKSQFLQLMGCRRAPGVGEGGVVVG